MKNVIIAEKPSVAQSIAAIVGAGQRKDGYLEGNGCAVTWAFGHLVGLAMPEAYGFAGFRRENLPILPAQFTLIPRQKREGKEYKDDPGVVRQLNIIKGLFEGGDRIIVATDAGREGELIFRYIYHYLGCTKPFILAKLILYGFLLMSMPTTLPLCGYWKRQVSGKQVSSIKLASKMDSFWIAIVSSC